MSCYCNLPVRTYTCLSTGYKFYKCPRTKNDWNYKHKKWTVTESRVQPCGFIKIKKKFSFRMNRTVFYIFKIWKEKVQSIINLKKIKESKKINRKLPVQQLFSHLLKMKVNSEIIEGEALRVSILDSIDRIRKICFKYNYKWFNPKKETFQQFIEKLYKYFSVSMVFYNPINDTGFPVPPFKKLPPNTIDTIDEICNKRRIFLEKLDKVKKHPIDIFNEKLKKIIKEKKRYRMLKRREERKRNKK